MSLFDLSEAPPSNSQKMPSKQNFDGADFPTFGNVDRMSFPKTPSSGGSSTSPWDNIKETVTSPRTAGICLRTKFLVKDDVVSAMLPNKKKDNFTLLFEPKCFGKKVWEATSSSFSNVTSPSCCSAKFSEGLYIRVDDYMDQEGLNIEMPSHANVEAQRNMAVRRLILARTVSEDLVMQPDQEWMSDDFSSPSLRKNIASSSLLQRRATLSHLSSNDLESPMEPPCLKKSAFRKATFEILEEGETPIISRRNSIKSPGELNTTNFRTKLFKDTFDISDIASLKSSHSRNQSIISGFHVKPREEPHHAQSLTKLSPLTKPVPLADKTASYFTPQSNFKRTIGKIPMNTALTTIANRFRNIEQRVIAPKVDANTTSIGEILSKSGDSSPAGSITLN